MMHRNHALRIGPRRLCWHKNGWCHLPCGSGSGRIRGSTPPSLLTPIASAMRVIGSEGETNSPIWVAPSPVGGKQGPRVYVNQ